MIIGKAYGYARIAGVSNVGYESAGLMRNPPIAGPNIKPVCHADITRAKALAWFVSSVTSHT